MTASLRGVRADEPPLSDADGSRPRRNPQLLEREREKRTLSDAVAECANGRGRLVIVRGAAGTGKTALLDFACDVGAEQGARVLRARAAEFERDFPFGTFRQLLHPVVERASRAERARILAGPAAVTHPLFGARAASAGDWETRATALVEGLGWAVANLAHDLDAGIVLAIDDVHACDRASLRAIARVTLRLDELGALLVLALRPNVAGAQEDLLAWLAAEDSALMLNPASLTNAAVSELVEREFGVALDPSFTQAFVDVAGGNPLLTTELIAAVSAEGVRPDRTGSHAVRQIVPDAVLRLVRARLSRLGKPARMLAEAVAVLRSDVKLRQAAELADLKLTVASDALDELLAAGLIADGVPLTFAHPLVASAVERDIGLLGGRRAHWHAARVLDADGEPAERVAAHLLASPRTADRWAVDVLRTAAADRVRNGGARGAVPLLRRALDEPPPPELRDVLMRELAYAETAAGEPAARERLLGVLRIVDDSNERVRALRELSRLQFLNEQHREAALTIKQAMTEAGAGSSLMPGLLAEFLAYAGLGSSTLDPELSQEAERHVVELLSQLERDVLPDDPALRIHVAHALGGGRGPRAQVRRLVEDAMDCGPLERLPPHGIAPSWAVLALICVDELGIAEKITEQFEMTGRRSGSIHDRGLAAFSRAMISVESGALDRAVADADTALDLARSGVPTTIVWSAALLTAAHRLSGDMGAAQRSITIAKRVGEDDIAYGIALLARAELQLALGHAAQAWDDALAAAAALERFTVRDYPLFPWRLVAAEAGAHLGHRSSAVQYAQEELALARTSGAPRSIGRALVTLAKLANDPARELDLLEQAVEASVDSPARHFHADALYRLGVARRRLGLLDAAKAPLLSALEIAESCPAPRSAKAVRRELWRLGFRPRSASRSGRAAMTPAERRVAELAAKGRTNREIADALHLATSTVEYHLTRAFRKLGVTSRRDLITNLKTSPS